jgi:hypothetical protein
MKKFESNYYGLLPIYLADQRFMQDATAEQIEALIAPWLPYATANSFILTGVEPDPLIPTAYSAGWLVLNGKIYRCNSFTAGVVAPGNQRVWNITENNLSGGAKTPKRTLTPVETWKEYLAAPALVANTVTDVIPFALPRLADLITASQAQTYFTRNGTTINGSYRLQFLQMKDKYVHCVGTLWPNMVVLSDPSASCDITVSVPFTLDATFKDVFDYETQANVFGVDALGGDDPHLAWGYKIWASFAAAIPFAFRLSAEEITAHAFSSSHRAAVPINIILKIQ